MGVTKAQIMKREKSQSTLKSKFASIPFPGFGRFSSISTRAARILWAFILVFSLVAFTVHTVILLLRFAKRDTTTSTILNGVDFVFPDITICNNFPLSYARTKAFGTVKFAQFSERSGNLSDWRQADNVSLVNLSGDHLMYQVKNFWKTVFHNDDEFKFGVEFNKYSRPDNPVSRRTLSHYATQLNWYHSIEELVLLCEFRGKPCANYGNFSEHLYPLYGKCWTFKPIQRTVSGSGISHSLGLLLQVANRRALLSDPEILNWLRGVVVTIHEPDTFGEPGHGTNVMAAVGKHTLIQLEITRSIRLNQKARPCVVVPREPWLKSNAELQKQLAIGIIDSVTDNEGERWSSNQFRYSDAACKLLKQQYTFWHQCGCLSEALPLSMEILSNILLSLEPGNGTAIKNDNYTQPLNWLYCHFVSSEFLMGPIYRRSDDGSAILVSPTAIDTTQLLDTNTKTQSILVNGKPIPTTGFSEIDSRSWKSDVVSQLKDRVRCHKRITEEMHDIKFSRAMDQNIDHKRHNQLHTDTLIDACSPSCDSLQYHASLAAFEWPMSVSNAQTAISELMKLRLDDGSVTDSEPYIKTMKTKLNQLEDIRDNFVKVDIFAKQTLGTLIEEMYEYPFSGFFSDFGGVLGLWLGLSFITIIEILSSCCGGSQEEDLD